MTNVQAIGLMVGLCGAAGIAWGAYPLPNEARIDEIAATLSEEPGFPEYNITNRVFWDRVWAKDPKAAQGAVDYAKNIAAVPLDIPDESTYTNISGWARASLKVANDVQVLALGECLENKGRFIPRIVTNLEVKSSQTTWMNPYHDRSFGCFFRKYQFTDLSVGQNVQALAVALDHLRGRLPEATVRRIDAAMWYNCYSNYLAKAANPKTPRNSWFFGDANWNVACHGWVVGAALRTVPDKRLRARFIEAAERGYPYYLNGFSDGYCNEGLDYWNFGYGMYESLAWIVRAATRGQVDFFAHPKAKLDYVYAYACRMTPALAPSFGDGTASSPSRSTLYFGAQAWPEFMTAEVAKARSGLGSFPSMPYCSGPAYMDRPLATARAADYRFPIRSHFPAAQLLVCRPRQAGPQTVSVCFRGGHNACPHNHNDVGQYVIAVGDLAVVEDPSGGVYTLKTFGPQRYENPILNSYAHAVPVVDGKLQSAGRQATSKVLLTDFTETCDTMVLDLSRAYLLATNKIGKLTRTMRYWRDEGVVEIEDEVAFVGKGTFESPISTFGLVLPTGRANEYSIVRGTGRGDARLRVALDAHGGSWRVKNEIVTNERRVCPRRFAVVFDQPCERARVTFRFTAEASCVATDAARARAYAGPFGKLLAYYDATRYPERDLALPETVCESADPAAAMQGLVDFLMDARERSVVDTVRLSAYRKKKAEGSATERALPFVPTEALASTPAYAIFRENFNRERLVIDGPNPGTHTVFVDKMEFGTWDAQELGAGIDLAGNPRAPQYAQSVRVRDLIDRLWKLLGATGKTPAVEAEIKALREQIRKAARPVSHSYRTSVPERDLSV